MKWLTRESFSERRFLGWRPFVTHVFLLAWMVGFICELIRAHSALAGFDVMGVLFVWPMIVLLLVFLLAFVCLRLWRVSLVAALGGLWAYLPALFFVPVFELVIRSLGFMNELGFASGWQALTVLLTGGLLPVFVVPPAFQLMWILVFGWIAWSWRRSNPSLTVWQLAQGLGVGYVGFSLLFLLPSFISWVVLVREVPIWSTVAPVVSQGFTVAQIDGYAWRAIYERFPLAIGGEAHVSQTWLFASFAWMSCLVVLFLQQARSWKWSWSRWNGFVGRERFIRLFGSVLLGLVAAMMFGEGHSFTWTHAFALIELVMTVGLYALVQAADVDLIEVAHESLASDRPLATGLITTTDLEEARWLWLAAASLGAFLLGLPVFLACMFAYVAHCQALSATHRWAFLSWTSLPGAGLFLVGWMAVAERGSFGTLAPAFSALVFLALFAWNWRKFDYSS